MITLLPTPIGNLGDVSLRMLEALAESEIVLCEDTRVTKKLITLLQKNPIIEKNFPNIFLNKEFYAFHSHNQDEFLKKTSIDFFKKQVVFLSDAGMPCVNDPGALLVKYAMENNIDYDVLPGSNASILAYCMSGIIDDGFMFGGFLPHKQQARKRVLENFLSQQVALDKELSVMFYESPHRILESLQDICEIDRECYVFAIKEMTKKHQKSFCGEAYKVFETLKQANIQGEWVLILKSQKEFVKTIGLGELEAMDIPPKIKAKLIAKLTNQDAKEIYNNLVKQKG